MDKKSILEKLEEVAGGVLLFDPNTREILLVEENTGKILSTYGLSDVIGDEHDATVPPNLKLKKILDNCDTLFNDPRMQQRNINYPHVVGNIARGTYARILPGSNLRNMALWTF